MYVRLMIGWEITKGKVIMEMSDAWTVVNGAKMEVWDKEM